MGSSVGSGGTSVGLTGLSVGAAAGGSVGSGASVAVLQAPKASGKTNAISSTHAKTFLDILLPPLEFLYVYMPQQYGIRKHLDAKMIRSSPPIRLMFSLLNHFLRWIQ
jgi:hypothetical protein